MPPGGFLYRRAKLARASAAVRRRRRGTDECSAGDTVSPRAVGDGTHRADRSWLIFIASATTGDAGQAAAAVRSIADLSTPRSISPASRRAGPVPVAGPRPRDRAAGANPQSFHPAHVPCLGCLGRICSSANLASCGAGAQPVCTGRSLRFPLCCEPGGTNGPARRDRSAGSRFLSRVAESLPDR